MGKEIERKFLVAADWKPSGPGKRIVQGYLSDAPKSTVRVRIADGRGYITVKGETKGIERSEFEYEIPLEDAEEMLTFCAMPPIEKYRHEEYFNGRKWEIDIFCGENAPLVLAEIELSAQDEKFCAPTWLGKEVSDDPRYYNSNLSHSPYSAWAKR